MDDVTLLRVIPGVTLTIVTSFNKLLLDVHFDKYTVGLHYIHILSILENLQGDQRSTIMLSINCLNSSFCSLECKDPNQSFNPLETMDDSPTGPKQCICKRIGFTR